jgi:hypothetical protein
LKSRRRPEEKYRGGASHDSQHPTLAEKRVELLGNQSALALELLFTVAGAVIFSGLLSYVDPGHYSSSAARNFSSVIDEFLCAFSLRLTTRRVERAL